ncbi:MAG: hypothetical protein ACTSQF_14240 [Candidatus Heimdallarchaeaceae archaeon]
MKKAIKLSLVVILMFALASNFAIAQEVDGLYYSDLMVKDGTFTWNVSQSVEFYEDIPLGVNFTVTLKDDLYPGPISVEDLEKVYASVKVDGNKYTGEGFPLFWHTYKLETESEITTNTSIREEFEEETSLFNVTDGPAGAFNVNFTIIEDQYILFVDMDVNITTGLTVRYFENFQDNDTIDSTIELVYLAYTTESPMQALWAIAGVLTIGALVVVRKRRRK